MTRVTDEDMLAKDHDVSAFQEDAFRFGVGMTATDLGDGDRDVHATVIGHDVRLKEISTRQYLATTVSPAEGTFDDAVAHGEPRVPAKVVAVLVDGIHRLFGLGQEPGSQNLDTVRLEQLGKGVALGDEGGGTVGKDLSKVFAEGGGPVEIGIAGQDVHMALHPAVERGKGDLALRDDDGGKSGPFALDKDGRRNRHGDNDECRAD